MKTILFYYVSEIAPTLGGVERVVSLQYHELTRRGYRVLTIHGRRQGHIDAIPDQYLLPVPKQLNSKKNITYIRDFIQRENVNIAFNFNAIFSNSSLCLVEACRKGGIPLISVLHNTLEVTLWNMPIIHGLMEHNCGKIFLHRLLALVHRLPFYKGGRYLYNHAAATVVLSPCYISEYKDIIGVDKNVFSIYNPLPISIKEFVDCGKKENIVLFVGRLEKQKGVDKLIRIWSKVKAPGWNLQIVGSGSEETKLKEMTQKLGVSERISFEGHQNPLPYYRKARLFCLTSIYEGYPMTLIECQAFGCVPILYNSFLAASDIVHAGENGLLIPAFQEQRYVNELQQLILDEVKLQRMSECCRKEVDRYSVDRIMEQWVELIEHYRL